MIIMALMISDAFRIFYWLTCITEEHKVKE